MKTNKVLNVLVIIAMMVILVPVAGVLAAPAEKVDVCHMDGTGVYHLINISDNAYPAHQEHGDAYTGELVPNLPGKKFADDCSVINVKELVDSLTILPNGASFTSISLITGQTYELKAIGTFKYNGAGDWADAEWYLKSGVTVKGDVEGSKPYVLDVSINGYSINTDWGDYQPSHIYTKSIVGNGVPVNFSIYDSAYGDNSGFITVEIWQIN